MVGEGPKLKIRDVEFVGNAAISDGKLEKQIKDNKPKACSRLDHRAAAPTRRAKFEEDAEKVVELLPQQRLLAGAVGQPEIKTLENTKDGKTRWIQLGSR